jgi:hypothetical protein
MGAGLPPMYFEAEYADGFVYRETEEDKSFFLPKRNCFFDVVNRLPESKHGPMLKFSLVHPPDDRIEVDFTILPRSARPVRLKHVDGVFRDYGVIEKTITKIEFGWEIVDADGNRIDGEIVPVF